MGIQFQVSWSPAGQSAWGLLSAGPVHQAQVRRLSSTKDGGDAELWQVSVSGEPVG